MEIIKDFLLKLLKVDNLNHGEMFRVEHPFNFKEDELLIYDENKIKSYLLNSEEYNFNGIDMITEKTIEIPIASNRYRDVIRKNEKSITSLDGNINFYISNVTPTYFIHSIIELYIKEENKNIIKKSMKLFRLYKATYTKIENGDDTKEPKELLEYIIENINIKSLFIESKKVKDYKSLLSLKTTFAFEFTYKFQEKLTFYNNFEDVFFIKQKNSNNIDRSKEEHDVFSCRIYDNNLVEYYLRFINTDDLYIKYISCYHILEYYYEKVYKDDVLNEIKKIITHPDFSYNSNTQLDKVMKKVSSKIKNNKEHGQGNELESLKLVINKFCNIDEIYSKLSDEEIQFFEQNKSFSLGDKIDWKNEKGLSNLLAKRIYSIRNSLIHSKVDKGDKVSYQELKHKELLSKEIPLIRLIAENVIISNSKIN